MAHARVSRSVDRCLIELPLERADPAALWTVRRRW